MTEIVFTAEEISYITFFEGATGVRVIDCIVKDEDNLIIFVIEGPAIRAIGRDGSKIRTIKEYLNKDIKVVSYSDDPRVFMRNFFAPYKPRKVEIVEEKGKRRIYVHVDPTIKPKAIGKNGKNVRLAKELLQRHFKDIDSVIVV
ncbi:MAG: NusA-like transcription termination signal-binding factor [Euryarchaeota archaeon]|nr:NusA-like transcription termination signal-binding factor [Euryarchaeota archaeon]MCD6158346.1 NusA-like transcription termination signal-binding factor [Euryarchaeota archaeon]RLF67823.1 MAG: NusA-like transcription termination signal-binding factor [Thermoplasmata archaeon]